MAAFERRNHRLSFQICLKFTVLVLMILPIFLIGCSDENTKGKKLKPLTGIRMEDYFPLQSGKYWSFNWQNERGDSWRGSIAVFAEKREQGLNIYLISDTTETLNGAQVFTSAYLWDAEGLKHLNRIEEQGDSIVFTPPRRVLPAKMDSGEIYRQVYTHELYESDRKLECSINVKQEQKLVDSGSITTETDKWNDCVAVETVWTNQYADGSIQVKRKIVWYAKGVGPVKIISDIPISSQSRKGEAVGELAAASK